MSEFRARSFRRTPAAILIAAGVVLTAGCIAAADWRKDLGPSTPGPHPAMPTCSIVLRLSWKGMLDAGRLEVDFAPADARKPGLFVTRATATSLGPAAGLFPYKGSMWSEVQPATLRPRFFSGTETDRKETVLTTNRYHPGNVECLETTPPTSGGTPSSRRETFRFSPVHDMFSAILLVRSRKLAVGDTLRLVIQPFRSPYLLTVRVHSREPHLGRKSIRLGVGLRKIDRKSLALLPYKKMKREATLWLSDDADRIPLEFRAPVFIGDVRATLSRFEKP